MATFKDIEAIDNGARFVNVDLHIHSYGASADVSDTAMTPKAIVDSALRQGLSVIAITDHNSEANVAEAVSYAAAFSGQILVIPGVEVTTAHGHLLAYFAPDKVDVLSTFLAKLDLVGAKGAENTHTAKSMADVISEAYKLGGICIAAHIDREKTGFDKFTPGFQNWKRDILRSPGLFGLECDAITTLDWYSEEDTGNSEATVRHEIFMSRREVPDLKGRHHLAHLQGSDSHSLARFETAVPSKPWTRMKLTDLTWEAFRTALTDPTARVKAKAALPKAIPRVVGISMTGGFLDGELIQFSDNLNCFIGGRGTGKSTAIRALAYAFGINEEFESFENCPDLVVVFCQDADGTLYRYERSKGGEVLVKAKEDGTIDEVPVDSFRIEYFGQGELAEVAKDPLNTPQLFQGFLDRHTSLGDLREEEDGLLAQLRENAATLVQLETRYAQLTEKKKTYGEIEKKLKIAEDGKLKEIVSIQSQVTSEQTIGTSTKAVSETYSRGLSLSKFERSYDDLVESVGDVTNDEASKEILKKIEDTFGKANEFLKQKASEINAELKAKAKELDSHCSALSANHAKIRAALAPKIADLKSKGLAGNLSELEQLLARKKQLGKEITEIEQKAVDLKSQREERVRLRSALSDVREKMTARRKAQLAKINANLGRTLQDYTVFVRYEAEGIIDEFLEFIKLKMAGTYFPEQAARTLCSRVTPSELGDWVRKRDVDSIEKQGGISSDWAHQVVEKLRSWTVLFELQILAKQPKPTITVRTKSDPPREFPVIQLSDGQRHTILLTIAMLAETNVPLIIDQPEDDLDNAFISSSIVSTLRSVKERRQVILVTHNANIAVLGDSELLLPMHRENDCGHVHERGSIDKEETKLWVQRILEGGPDAFLRRKEIYGH
jgi:DNA repair ATPase RecN